MLAAQILWIALFALSATVSPAKNKNTNSVQMTFPIIIYSTQSIPNIIIFHFHGIAVLLFHQILYISPLSNQRCAPLSKMVTFIHTYMYAPRSIEIAYACPNCAGVAFCSIECQKEACSTYHAFECKFMDMMIGSGMSILCFIAFRMITQHGSVEVAIEKGCQTIRELCTHSNERKASDYLQRTVMSAFLLRIMQKSGFFGRRTSESGNF